MSVGAALVASLAVSAPSGYVNVSDWGWDAEDATAALQSAVNSGVRRLYVDPQAGDWNVRPIAIGVTNLELVVGAGVTIRAKRGAFKGKSDMLFKILPAARRIVLRGEPGAQLAMNKSDYQDASAYVAAEWRHTLGIYGTLGVPQGVAVSNLTLATSGGDGVYVNKSSDVVLENLVCRGHHRQGISVIGASNLLVRACTFFETSGTAPKCGLDVEPNNANECLQDVVFDSCDFYDNDSSGVSFYLKNLTTATPPISLTFRKCRSWGNGGYGFRITACGSTNAVSGTILLEDCRVWGNASHPLALNNTLAGSDRLKVIVRDSVLDARGAADKGLAVASTFAGYFGNLEVENTDLLVDSGDGVSFSSVIGSGAAGMSGVLRVVSAGVTNLLDLAQWQLRHPGDPDVIRFHAADFDYRELVPLFPDETLATPVQTGRLRGSVEFLQYVRRAGEYPILFNCLPVGKGKPISVAVEVTDADGKALDKFTLSETNTTYTIRAASAGLRRFVIATGSGTVNIRSEWPGCGFVAKSVGLFKHPGKRYHFAVPPSDERVCVLVSPQEASSAELLAAAGDVRDSKPYSTVGQVLRSDRRSRVPELWSVRFPQMMEDTTVKVGAPALPILTPERRAMLAPRSFTNLTTTVPAATLGGGVPLSFAYDPGLELSTVLSVTGTLTCAAPVEVVSDYVPYASVSGEPVRVPILVAPAGTALKAADFVFVPKAELSGDELPQHVRLETDNAAARPVLYAVIEPVVELTTADSGYRGWDAAVAAGSALQKAGSWSDGRLPHAGAHYLVRSCLHAIPEHYVDYTFPGESLTLMGASFYVYGKGSAFRAPALSLSGLVRQGQFSYTTIRSDRIALVSNVVLQAYSGKCLTVDGELCGTSDVVLRGESVTSSPHGYFAFSRANTNWFGTLTLESTPQCTSSDVPISRWAQNHITLRLTDGLSLGGRLPAMNYRALEIQNHNDVLVTNDVVLAGDMNRGLFVSQTCGVVNVGSGKTLTVNWPVTLDATLYKLGAGTLALGGEARTASVPEPRLVVSNGCVKVLRHDALNGFTVDLAQNSSAATLALDYSPVDDRIRRYGLCNVSTDRPFVSGQKVRLRFDGLSPAGQRVGRRGLVTVRTSVADWVGPLLVLPAELSSLPVGRRDDPKSGTTTFFVSFGDSGMSLTIASCPRCDVKR